MKPNEGYEIGQEYLIAQLGLLILEGRKSQAVKSSLEDCINYNEGVLYQRKEDFLSFWKSCQSMYIEVWLYRQGKFKDKEAIDGHSGYLLIEQWEIKLNRSSNHGFHCTEKMLIQAIKSKLYFSQLSAWLSLTKGKFPRHTYFRLCQTENKTPLKRFIRAPDFHQFPEVSLAPTTELVVSVHSLPHSDLPMAMDYPMFLWVLTDQASDETPHRKIAEKLSSDFEEDLVLKDECSYNISQNYSTGPSHVVRKLEFENVSMAGQRKALDEQRFVEKEFGYASLSETLENVKRTSMEQSVYSTETELLEFSANEETSEDVAKEKENLIFKEGRNVSRETSKQENKHLSLTKTHSDMFRNSKTSTQNHKLSSKEMQCSVEAGFFDKDPVMSSAKSVVPKSEIKDQLPGSSEKKESNCSAEEVHRTSPVLKEQMCDQGIYEIMQRLQKDDSVSPLCRKTESSKTLASGTTTLGCKKNFVPMEKRDSEIFTTTDLNSKCPSRDISRKSLLTRNIRARSNEHTTLNARKEKNDVLNNCRQDRYNDRMLNDFGRDSLQKQRQWLSSESSNGRFCNFQDEQIISGKERKFRNISQVSAHREKSNLESLEARCSEHTTKKSWSVDQYGNVLHRRKDEIEGIPPEIRHVMDQEYEKTFSERLRKCCLSSEGCYGKEHGVCKRKSRKSEKKEEDNVFRKQMFTAIPSSNSRHHFRHASTGTLAVFHPRTGLPVSSSPAPFRKTSQKQTVDDICSPSREPSSLSDQCGNLSKSAPTLTTQSLLVNFEESVLNDRLLPDGVVEGFTAELSASGSKKCLAHVTLPVQAYFFKLSDDNAPSPYMGYISLDVPALPKKGYHVPKKGTIQLTLFNPSQTVVKVFVVLYDFSDMQPNFQTFLRQKTTSLVKSDGLVDRVHDNLHYLIHLRFASSKSGRIYLHTDIRVIFARHPPDQGHLRTATSGPTNPKYVPRQARRGEF